MADPTPLDLSGADGPDYSKLPPPPGPGDYDGGKSAGEGQDGKDDGKKCGTHSSEGSPGHQGLQGNSGQKGGTGNHGGDFTFKAANMTGNWPVNTSGGKGGGGQTGGEGGTGQAGGAGGKACLPAVARQGWRRMAARAAKAARAALRMARAAGPARAAKAGKPRPYQPARPAMSMSTGCPSRAAQAGPSGRKLQPFRECA